MIKNRDNDISKWYNGRSSIKKVYQGGHVRFQEYTMKITSGSLCNEYTDQWI